MTTEVEICNQALAQIRADNINNLTEGSLEADACNAAYADARRFLIRDMPWPFTMETLALAVVDTDHPDGWSYVYDYPSTCLKLLQVAPVEYFRANRPQPLASSYDACPQNYPRYAFPPLEFRVARYSGSRAILTDIPEAYAQIQVDVTDPTEFDPTFQQALMWYIAAHIAVPIMGVDRGKPLRNEALSLYRAFRDSARVDAMSESRPSPPPDSELLRTRY